MSSYKYILLFIFLLAGGRDAAAQPSQIKFDQIGLEQGLSQSTVYAITQDKQGFIWFGTQDGLNRYDGYSVTVFKHNPDDRNSIADNTIWCLLSDKKGNLWIGTMRGGLDCYVPSKNKFYHYRHQDGNSTTISDNDISSLFEDSKGRIWIGTRNRGLNLYNPSNGTFTRFLYDEKINSSIGDNSVRDIREDRQGNLWIATGNGLSKAEVKRVNVKSGIKFTKYLVESKKEGEAGNNIKALCMDSEGALWIGNWGKGLIRYDYKNNKFIHVDYNFKNSTPSSIGSYVASIVEDSGGILWIATYDGGLINYDKKKNTFNRFASTGLMTLFKDNSGILWLGTFINGVKIYDKRKNRFIHYYDDPNSSLDMKGNPIQSILKDKDGELWVATYGFGLNRFNINRDKVINYTYQKGSHSGINSNTVYALCQVKDGSIWIAADKGQLNRFDKKTNKFSHYKVMEEGQIFSLCGMEKGELLAGGTNGVIRFSLSPDNLTSSGVVKKSVMLKGKAIIVIYKSRDNSYWIGTLRGGVYHYIPSRDTIISYQPVNSPLKSINNNTVISFYDDGKGGIWMGTYGGGLNRFDSKSGTFRYYNKQSGLANDVIYGILPDKSGNLWLSTNNGISRLNPATGMFSNFDVRDGLQGNEFNQGAYYASHDGELFFGGINGFNSFFPENIDNNKFIPKVYLTDFKVFDKTLSLPLPVSFTKTIRLSYAQNFFSFEFVALNYTSPEKNKYAYMLEGFDKGWHYVSSSHRYASYTNLDPGEYKLNIKGSNNDGLWNEAGISVNIVIMPPFWMTWWFRSFIFAGIIGILFLAYKYRVNKLIAVERTRLRISQDLHDEVSASITGIVYFVHALVAGLGEKVSPNVQKLLTLINDSAVNVQESMSDIIWSINPGNDKWGIILPKLRRYASDLCETKGIKYTMDIPQQMMIHSPEMEMRHDLWLIFKELVTNAVKHSNCTQLNISISEEHKNLHLTVSDNGCGFDSSLSTDRNGVKNIYARIKSINGSAKLNTFPGNGTQWDIYFQLKKSFRLNGTEK